MLYTVVPKTSLYNAKKRLPVRAALALAVLPGACFPIVFMLLAGGGRHIPVMVLMGSIGCMLAFYSAKWSLKLKSRVGASIKPAIEERYGVALDGFSHVGVSPNKDAKSYAGDSSWDIGFLAVGDRFVYYGDQCWFTLSRDQIIQYRIVGRPGASPRLLIAYTWPTWEGTRWINIEARDAHSRTDQYLTLQRLQNQIAIMPGPRSLLPRSTLVDVLQNLKLMPRNL